MTEPTDEVLSPYLPNSKIQWAWFKRKAAWLVANAIKQDDCLISHLKPNAKGYIPVSFGRTYRWRANRVVFFAANPHANQDLLVLHKCDNRACINISHLFLGTPQDNTDDMIIKGRKIDDPFVGERMRHRTWERIKPLLEQGFTRHEIAERLHLSPNTIWNYISPKGNSYKGGFESFSTGNGCDVGVGFDLSGDVKELS